MVEHGHPNELVTPPHTQTRRSDGSEHAQICSRLSDGHQVLQPRASEHVRAAVHMRRRLWSADSARHLAAPRGPNSHPRMDAVRVAVHESDDAVTVQCAEERALRREAVRAVLVAPRRLVVVVAVAVVDAGKAVDGDAVAELQEQEGGDEAGGGGVAPLQHRRLQGLHATRVEGVAPRHQHALPDGGHHARGHEAEPHVGALPAQPAAQLQEGVAVRARADQCHALLQRPRRRRPLGVLVGPQVVDEPQVGAPPHVALVARHRRLVHAHHHLVRVDLAPLAGAIQTAAGAHHGAVGISQPIQRLLPVGRQEGQHFRGIRQRGAAPVRKALAQAAHVAGVQEERAPQPGGLHAQAQARRGR
mmetsp:Transcript_37735/g.97926  ORF Transcript_37735/g.97926 Transcript_37735/m.97926 type:complete len:360 (+) Transcript_37735:106-1185(+)